MPTILPGCLHPSNVRHVLDWEDSGVLAYACHNLVFLVDAFTQRRIRVLEFHTAAVSAVAWSPRSALLAEVQPARLASADISGLVVVCEPTTATKISSFSLANATVNAIRWFVWKDMQRDFVMVLHAPQTMILWNADTGEKVWSYNYSTPLFDLSLDPFSPTRCAMSSQGSVLLLVADLDLSVAPTGSGQSLQLAPPEEASDASTIVCLRHHTAYQNVVFAATRNRVYCVNQELFCVYSKIDADGFICAVLPMSSRDAVFTVSVTGVVNMWLGKYTANSDRAEVQLCWERVAVHEGGQRGVGPSRGANASRVVACVLCPATLTTVAVLYNSGRMTFWQLESDRVPSYGLYRSVFAEDLLKLGGDLQTTPVGELRLRQCGLSGALPTGVSCVRVRPLEGLMPTANGAGCGDGFDETLPDLGPLAERHLAAVGTTGGILQLVDVFTREIVKEFSVQSSPVKCVEWASPYAVLTAGYNHALSTSHVVRNDLYCTDIRTGVSRRMRPEGDESPITMIRVSFYQSYVAIAFQREPLEIWDLRGMRLLRRMSRACPLIVDMAWSCKHCTVKTTESSGQSVYRENLVVLDSDNRLYHIVVKGLHVRDGKEVSTQWKSGGWSIRCMAWKDDVLAMGDADGRLAVWDLARRQSRHTRIERTPVKRMQFSRLAGDHTLAVLHQNELVLWDTDSLTKIQSIRLEGGRAAVDVDLCGVSPVLVTSDNMLWYAADAVSNEGAASPLHVNPDAAQGWQIQKTESRAEFLRGNATTPALREFISRHYENADGPLARLRNELSWQLWSGDRRLADLLTIVLAKLQPECCDRLPPHLQLFWSDVHFKQREMQVVCACCRVAEVDEARLVERAVVLGGSALNSAVDRLIGSARGDVRLCSLKAALLVSNHEGEHSKSLIKLIATNLIANDLIEDGVELLFLVRAGADACKYLQSQRLWHKSAQYAKMGLEEADATQILQRVANFLAVDQKSLYVLWQSACADWPTVVQLLTTAGHLETAKILLDASLHVDHATSLPSPEPEAMKESTGDTLPGPL